MYVIDSKLCKSKKCIRQLKMYVSTKKQMEQMLETIGFNKKQNPNSIASYKRFYSNMINNELPWPVLEEIIICKMGNCCISKTKIGVLKNSVRQELIVIQVRLK